MRELDQQKIVNDHQNREIGQQKINQQEREIDQQKRIIDQLQKSIHSQQYSKEPQLKQLKGSSIKVGCKTEP